MATCGCCPCHVVVTSSSPPRARGTSARWCWLMASVDTDIFFLYRARVNPTATAGSSVGEPKDQKRGTGKAKAKEEDEGREAPRKKARTKGEEILPQGKGSRPSASLVDRNPESFFASRTSVHLPLVVDHAKHSPFLLVTIVRTNPCPFVLKASAVLFSLTCTSTLCRAHRSPVPIS
jgi:hypothetical protein